MKYILPVFAFVAASACADENRASRVSEIEELGQFDLETSSGPERVVTKIDGCIVTIDTIAAAGERNGQIDHRDVFHLAQVSFRNDGGTPPNYGVSLIPDLDVADGVPIDVSYLAEVPDAITRTIPVWKDVRDPYAAGPTWDGVDYVIAQRQRGSFFLSGHEGQRAAHAFVSALVAYGETYCQPGVS